MSSMWVGFKNQFSVPTLKWEISISDQSTDNVEITSSYQSCAIFLFFGTTTIYITTVIDHCKNIVEPRTRKKTYINFSHSQSSSHTWVSLHYVQMAYGRSLFKSRVRIIHIMCGVSGGHNIMMEAKRISTIRPTLSTAWSATATNRIIACVSSGRQLNAWCRYWALHQFLIIGAACTFNWQSVNNTIGEMKCLHKHRFPMSRSTQ